MNGPTREEFERLYTTIDHGFKGVHDRLDVLNGRTQKGEVSDAEVRTRLTSLEKEVFRQPRRRHGDHAGDAEGWAMSFSKREGALIALGLTTIVALTKVLEVVVTRAFSGLVGR